MIDYSPIMDRAVESLPRISKRKRNKESNIRIWWNIILTLKRGKSSLILWIKLDYVLNANGQLKQDRCYTGHVRWVSKLSSLCNSRRRCQRLEVDGNRRFLFSRDEMSLKWSRGRGFVSQVKDCVPAVTWKALYPKKPGRSHTKWS